MVVTATKPANQTKGDEGKEMIENKLKQRIRENENPHS
jgi:hypothetical protein